MRIREPLLALAIGVSLGTTSESMIPDHSQLQPVLLDFGESAQA